MALPFKVVFHRCWRFNFILVIMAKRKAMTNYIALSKSKHEEINIKHISDYLFNKTNLSK